MFLILLLVLLLHLHCLPLIIERFLQIAYDIRAGLPE
jgi:hypothetical protein